MTTENSHSKERAVSAHRPLWKTREEARQEGRIEAEKSRQKRPLRPATLRREPSPRTDFEHRD